MNLGEPADVNYPKPLPTPGRDEKLPPPPPSDWSSAQHSPPAPPPKIVEVFEPQPHQLGPQPPQISPLNTSGLGPGAYLCPLWVTGAQEIFCCFQVYPPLQHP